MSRAPPACTLIHHKTAAQSRTTTAPVLSETRPSVSSVLFEYCGCQQSIRIRFSHQPSRVSTCSRCSRTVKFLQANLGHSVTGPAGNKQWRIYQFRLYDGFSVIKGTILPDLLFWVVYMWCIYRKMGDGSTTLPEISLLSAIVYSG